MSTVVVEVALRGHSVAWVVPPRLLARAGWDAKWNERPRLLMRVASSTPVGELIRGAMSIWSIDSDGRLPGGLPLYKGDDGPAELGTELLPLLDKDNGLVVWNKSVYEASVDQMIDSGAVGLFDGDPMRLYLVPQSAAGAHYGAEWWEGATAALLVAADVLSRLDGVLGGVERLRSGVVRAVEAIHRIRARLEPRGGTLNDVQAIVERRPRTQDVVTQYLGLTDADATALLGLLGYGLDGTGHWTVADQQRVDLIKVLFWAHSVVRSHLLTRKHPQDDAHVARALSVVLEDYLVHNGITKTGALELLRRFPERWCDCLEETPRGLEQSNQRP